MKPRLTAPRLFIYLCAPTPTRIIDFQQECLIDGIIADADSHIQENILDGRLRPTLAAATAMIVAPELIKDNFEKNFRQNSSWLQHTMDNLFENTKWDFDQIRSLSLQILQISQDTELTETTLKLDQSYRAWENAHATNKRIDTGYESIFDNAVNTFQRSAEVYKYIANKYFSKS